MKKTINNIFFVIFIIFAFLQLNDPDGLLWFTIYCIVATICIVENFKPFPNLFLILIISALIIYAICHFSLFITFLKTEHKEELFGEMVYNKPYLEGTREFLGLIIAVSGVAYQIKLKNSQY